MARDLQVVRCLLVSPGDLAADRAVVRDAIARWNGISGWGRGVFVEAVGWETHAIPELGQNDRNPQKILNDQILESCDFGIAMFWSDPGSPTDTHRSGSLEEIDRLRSSNRPVHLLFCSRAIPQERLQPERIAAVNAIRTKFQSAGLYADFASESDLRTRVQAILDHRVVLPRRHVFASRSDAAETIRQLIAAETDGISIVASTLGGTLRAVPDLPETLRSKPGNFRFNVMIAAPEHLVARARQEGLPAGAELGAAYRRIHELLQETEIAETSIRLYRAPPTCTAFVFHGQRAMLINPFSLSESGEDTLTVLVDGVNDPIAFDGFVQAHVERPLRGALTMSLAQFIPESNELVMGAMLRLITEYLRRGNSTPMVLAINGDTAVGKTRLAKDLQRRLENTDVSATLVSTDAWLRQSREERLDAGQTGLDAGRYALDELCSTLERLLAGEPVELPTYDHSLGRRGEPEKAQAGRVVIVEGLMSTHQRVKSDAVIWMEHAGELHAERRVSRDIEFRGYEPEAAVANWNRHLRDWPSFLATCRPLEIDLLITVNRMGMWLLEVPTLHHPSDNSS